MSGVDLNIINFYVGKVFVFIPPVSFRRDKQRARDAVLHISCTPSPPRYFTASKATVIASPAQYALLTYLLINSCHGPPGNYFHIAKRAPSRSSRPFSPLLSRRPCRRSRSPRATLIVVTLEFKRNSPPKEADLI